MERSLVKNGSKAFLNDIWRLSSEGHPALTPNAHKLSTNPPSANTSGSFDNSFRNMTSRWKTYITWTRRDVREVVGAKGQVGNASYLADDDQSTCHVAQILSSSQLLNVSVQMAWPFSQDLSSRAKSSARSGLRLTPRSGELWCYHALESDCYTDTITRISMSENGWTDDFLCKQWLEKSFIPQATERNASRKPILLIYDGHGSHDTLDVIALSREHNVLLYCLPPHTTHKLQPLDVGVFGPFQRAWAD